MNDLPLLDGFALVELGRLHESGAGGVDLNLERHAETLAVVEQMRVDGRNARRAGVEIATVLPLAGLRCAVGKFDFGAFANCPGAAAGTIARFEDSAIEACLAQFVRRDHAGDASAEDDD